MERCAQTISSEETDAGRAVTIREAVEDDVMVMARLVHELALAEDFPGDVTASPADLGNALFRAGSCARAVVAECDGKVVGFALFYPTYSTVTGRRGVHLEDIFVEECHRGGGVGHRLMAYLGGLAAETSGRLEWWVLRTNSDAMRFYRRLGARSLSEIEVWRLDHDALAALAQSAT